MAVAIIMDFEGATLDQYDDVMDRMGLDGVAPPGAIFHWVGASDAGIRVVDVWETQEAFDEFAQSQIAPHTAAAGIEGPPKMTYHEVHNTLTP